MRITNEILMYSNLKEYIDLFDNPKDLLADFLQYRLVPPHIGIAILNVVLANSNISGFDNISFIKVFDAYNEEYTNHFERIEAQIVIISKDHQAFTLRAKSFTKEFGSKYTRERKNVCAIQSTTCKTCMEEAVHNIAILINELI